MYIYIDIIHIYIYRYYTYIYIYSLALRLRLIYFVCDMDQLDGYARTPGSNLSNLFESFPAQDESGSGLFSDACGAMVCCGPTRLAVDIDYRSVSC